MLVLKSSIMDKAVERRFRSIKILRRAFQNIYLLKDAQIRKLAEEIHFSRRIQNIHLFHFSIVLLVLI